MKCIGIRELKSRLSGVLREVQAGETILVTDRGRVVAQLSAVHEQSTTYPSVERGLARLAATGALKIAERSDSPYAASPLSFAAHTARTLIDEAREEAHNDERDEARSEDRDVR